MSLIRLCRKLVHEVAIESKAAMLNVETIPRPGDELIHRQLFLYSCIKRALFGYKSIAVHILYYCVLHLRTTLCENLNFLVFI